MPTDNAKMYYGSCLCQGFQYTVTGDPLTFFVCHCVNCRKATGAGFTANAIFKAEQVVVTQGQESIKSFPDNETGSGNILNRCFCGVCGSNVFLKNSEEYTIVAAGTLNEEPGWVPRDENFKEGRRPWIKGIETKTESSNF